MTETCDDTAEQAGGRPEEIPSLAAGFTEMVGLRIVELGPDRVVARWTVRPQLYQPHGIVHGGVFCTAVETAASYGAAVWLGAHGNVVGVSNQTDFLRAVRAGELTATATPIHRGRLQQLWQVEIHDEADHLVARGQVRLQNVEDTDRFSKDHLSRPVRGTGE